MSIDLIAHALLTNTCHTFNGALVSLILILDWLHYHQLENSKRRNVGGCILVVEKRKASEKKRQPHLQGSEKRLNVGRVQRWSNMKSPWVRCLPFLIVAMIGWGGMGYMGKGPSINHNITLKVTRETDKPIDGLDSVARCQGDCTPSPPLAHRYLRVGIEARLDIRTVYSDLIALTSFS
ncbi:hypothetical protein LSTR_LSTR008082 [Laodelphax striatellus]|uniref:Uncharacterized protein n=1 Tax=Laodelphax striatellus TaxID=195883 RepID=A0A482XDQ2_LAOST|nr:hypothetical protein LSTR_LSTR008082 [Laodelphax striatellus]